MNELVRTCGVQDVFPHAVYHSSADYIFSLLDQQSAQLQLPRNSVYDAADCREKYACRYFMKAIAMGFISPFDNHGPFKLFCDGRVIDWEFCYAAPARFAGSIPWWLALQKPDKTINTLHTDAFFDSYLPKAELFLRALQDMEPEKQMDVADSRLSAHMRQSIETRRAWFYLACRMVSAVDLIDWDLLDVFCWGPRLSIAERIHSFTTNVGIHRDRERFVRCKIDQLRQYHEELGETVAVAYEEEQFDKSMTTRWDHLKKRGILVAGAIGVVSLIAVNLLKRRQ